MTKRRFGMDRGTAIMRTIPFVGGLAAWLAAAVLAAAGRWAIAVIAFTSGIVAWAIVRSSSRRSPVPFPAFLGWLLFLPRGEHTPARLLQLLQPKPGEHLVEIGCGPGIHALPVAAALPGGCVVAVDVQPRMLGALVRRAVRRGIPNVAALVADARQLPCADRSFDGAWAIGTLGEVPDPVAALRELGRVLKPGGRFLVGEVAIDPDFVPRAKLDLMAAQAGFAVAQVRGSPLAYTATLRRVGISQGD